MTKEEKNIIDDYLSQSMSLKKIEEKYGISVYRIKNILKKNNVKRYDYHLLLPQNQRKYPLNEHFFDEQNSEMVYVLGLLASDGTVRKNCNEIKLTFSIVDKDFLQLLQKKIGGTPIREYEDSKGFKNATWTFSSKYMKEKLSEYNIVPNKTFTFTFPLKLKKEYYKDFIRGYFDGDGSVSTAGPSAIRFQIGSKTKDVLEHIVNFFEEEGIERPSIYKRKDGFYYFQYSSVPTRKIYHILYDDAQLYLPRKKEKYEKLI